MSGSTVHSAPTTVVWGCTWQSNAVRILRAQYLRIITISSSQTSKSSPWILITYSLTPPRDSVATWRFTASPQNTAVCGLSRGVSRSPTQNTPLLLQSLGDTNLKYQRSRLLPNLPDKLLDWKPQTWVLGEVGQDGEIWCYLTKYISITVCDT